MEKAFPEPVLPMVPVTVWVWAPEEEMEPVRV